MIRASIAALVLLVFVLLPGSATAGSGSQSAATSQVSKVQQQAISQAVIDSPKAREALRGWDVQRLIPSRFVRAGTTAAPHWAVTLSTMTQPVARIELAGQTPEVEAVRLLPRKRDPLEGEFRGAVPARGFLIARMEFIFAGAALFLVVLLAPYPLASWRTLDVVALAALFVAGHLLLDRGGFVPYSVTTWILLAYLTARCGLVALGRAHLPRGDNGSIGLELLSWSIGAFAVLVTIALEVAQPVLSDIGASGFLGATSLLNGASPYAGAPSGYIASHTGAYGPLNYVLYIPGAMLGRLLEGESPWEFAMISTTLASYVVSACLAGFLAWRWRSRQAAATAFAGFATFPETVQAVSRNVNDFMIVAVILTALALLGRPFMRGIAIGAGAAIKIVPLAVAGLVIARGPRPVRASLAFVSGAALVTVPPTAAIVLMGTSPAKILASTAGLQLTRDDWGLSVWSVAGLDSLRNALAVVTVVALAAVALACQRLSDVRTAAAMCVCFGTLLLFAPLVYLHYVLWLAGPLIVVFATGSDGNRIANAESSQSM